MRQTGLRTIVIVMMGLSAESCGRSVPAAGVAEPSLTRTVRVEVLDEDGHALTTARVRLIQYVDGATVETSRGVTDGEGRVTVTARPGPSRLDIEREPPHGLRAFSTPLVSESDHQRVVLPRGATIQGRFVPGGVSPTEAIRWSCCRPDGRPTTFVPVESGGAFRMAGLDQGEIVELTVAWPLAFVDAADVVRRVRERVTLTAPAEHVELELARVPIITGTLQCEGKPFVPWAQQRLSITDASGLDSQPPARAGIPVRVDADGRFEALLLHRPVEPVVLTIEATRFETAERRVLLAGPWDMDRDLGAIELPRARLVHVIIRGDDGVAPPPVDVSWEEILWFHTDSVHGRKGRLLALAGATVIEADLEISRIGHLTFEAEGFLPATLAVDPAIDTTVAVRLDRGASIEIEPIYTDGGRVLEPLVVSVTTALGRRTAVTEAGAPLRLRGFERDAHLHLAVESPLAGAPLWERDLQLAAAEVDHLRAPVSRPFGGVIEFRRPDGARVPLDGTLYLAGPHRDPRSRIVGLIRDGRCEFGGIHEPSPAMEARFTGADAIPIGAGRIPPGGSTVTVTVPPAGR